MIYINDLSSVISIPRHTDITAQYFTLILTSHLSNEYVIVENEVNISANPLYYKFPISTDKLNVGEYEYKLISASSEIIECGLLVYGEFNDIDKVVNNTFSNDKIQYNG